ncbi:MAG: hypothetical protein HOP19_06465 [Acidobacteria bacterium]|nr:hypothetical protein [Acidobacteriota bacterium]
MTNRTKLQTAMKALSHGAMLVLLLSLTAFAAPAPQEQEEDSTRRLWNKQFEAARVKAKNVKSVAKAPTAKPRRQTASAEGELLGVTVWRLRVPAVSAAPSEARLLVKKVGDAPSQFQLERAEAETPFSEGQRLRISVETPCAGVSYLYVIDREVYADGTLGEPSLIFPGRTTPLGGNVAEAGKIISIPAQGDPLPYFTLQRSSPNHVSERLTLIISPEPLPLEAGQEKLEPAQLAHWEKQWGGPTERREARNSAGKQWTKAEQAAEQGERKLTQGDPLPQTIYRVKANPGGQVMVNLPLLITP